MIRRRDFLGATGTGIAGAGLAGAGLVGAGLAGAGLPRLALGSMAAPGASPVLAPIPAASDSEKLFLPKDDLAPATVDRLPLEWNKGRVRALQATLREKGLAGVLITDRWNLIYFTGLWHSTTERLFNVFFPADALEPVWFYPGLDRDLVASWWPGDGEMYFDWHHGQGAFPHQGTVQMGAKVDLFDWLLQGLKKRGYAGKRLGVDRELTPTAQKAAVRVLGQEMDSVETACVDLRMRKTPEEQALWRRAYEYFNRIHAYARDLLLTHGTDLTDYDLGTAATKWGTDLILGDLKRDGKPHTAVGVSLTVACRAGVGTAYPHPNQFHHNRIERGQALQIAGGIRIGGCGGELYRAFLLHPWTEHMKKVWTVSRDCTQIQREESIAGVTCSTVAYRIHQHQVRNGVQKYVYHRPGHGEGSEGHQPPYLALGDHTMLEPGMAFSVEPGLYDPEGGFGVNWSDDYFIRESGPARQMSRLPWSEEWCLVRL